MERKEEVILAKVFGPYLSEGKHSFVIISFYNEDGSVKYKKTLPYRLYLEEYEQGKHRYVYPEACRLRNERRVNKPKKEQVVLPEQIKCATCDKNFKPISSRSRFCSSSCKNKEKLKQATIKRRKKKGFSSFKSFDRQIVIPFLGTDKEPKWYYIIDLFRDKRDHRLILKKDCTLYIDADSNGIRRYRMQYDLTKSQRVKPVTGYKKFFFITDHGVLLSRRNKRELVQTLSIKGYCTHSTRIGGRNGKCILLRIHRLVGEAFIPNPDNKPFINHIDAVKTNNHYTNLEWCTNQENVDHAVKMGLIHSPSGIESAFSSLTLFEIEKILYLREIEKLSHYKIAEKLNVSRHAVTSLLSGKRYKKEVDFLKGKFKET